MLEVVLKRKLAFIGPARSIIIGQRASYSDLTSKLQEKPS